jgi:hypothetical protein
MNVHAWIKKRQAQLERTAATNRLTAIVLSKIKKSESSVLSAFFQQVERDHGRDARANLAKDLISEVMGIATPYISERPDHEHTALRYERFMKDPDFANSIKKKLPSEWHKQHVTTEAKAAYRHMLKKLSSISKHELSKAVTEKDWNRIGKANNSDAQLLVGHSAHMKDFPVNKKYEKLLKDPKQIKGLGRNMTSGISAKMVHAIPKSGVPGDEDKFMAKPYHKKIESATKGWVKKPIMGWATIATKALFNAGKIGHLAEDVAVHEHEGTPLTVHKFAQGYQDMTSSSSSNLVRHVNPLDAQQIGVIDFLTNNVDRHYGNLMVGRDDRGDATHENKLLAIDHERNFQYAKSLQESKPFRNIESKYDSPLAHIRESALKHASRHFDGYHELQDWWTNNKSDIQTEFAKHVQHIKDPSLREHISTNFHNRWNAMNDWAANLEDPWDKESLHRDFRKVRNVKQQEPRLTGKSIRSHLSKRPEEAMHTLVDIINKKDKLTDSQWQSLKSTMQEIVGKMSPHEMSKFYLSAMQNPNYNTKKIRQHNELNPKQVILNHLSEAQDWHNGRPVYKQDHLRAMVDAIDSIPHEDKQQLYHWRNHFANLLAAPQEAIA